MRALLVIGSMLLVSACSTLPDPDPNLAWVDLTPYGETSLDAKQVDERDWADSRYFEVQPGSHELTVRYQFPVTPSNIGPVDAPLWRDCQVKLTFKDFSAGQRARRPCSSRPASRSPLASPATNPKRGADPVI